MRLIKDSAIYVLGEIFTKSIPFFLLPYLTRVLGKEGFGELSLYQSVITLLIVFIGLSQDGAIARYYYFYGKRSLGLIAVTGGLLSFLIMLMIVIFSFFYLENIYCYIAFSAFIQSLLSVQLSVRQCQKKAMSYFYIQLFNGILSVVFTVSILQLISPTPVARIIAILLSGFFVVIFLGVYFYNDNRVIYSMKNYRSALIYITSFGLPLIIHQLGFFIKGQFDRLFIYKKYSFADLGLYSSAVQVATVLPVILLALNKAIVPYIYDALKSEVINIRKIRMWGVWSLAFVPIPSFLAFIIPESFYTFILGADFNGA
ncbi:oligosaccharide flippase family protein, partial [Pectobacterium parmentieri]